MNLASESVVAIVHRKAEPDHQLMLDLNLFTFSLCSLPLPPPLLLLPSHSADSHLVVPGQHLPRPLPQGLHLQHLLSSNLPNYVRGSYYYAVLHELLGNSIFAVDGHLWSLQIASHEFTTKSLKHSVNCKISDLLLPFLSRPCEEGRVVDLQETLRRFTFDNICSVAFGFDPNCFAAEGASEVPHRRPSSLCHRLPLPLPRQPFLLVAQDRVFVRRRPGLFPYPPLPLRLHCLSSQDLLQIHHFRQPPPKPPHPRPPPPPRPIWGEHIVS